MSSLGNRGHRFCRPGVEPREEKSPTAAPGFGSCNSPAPWASEPADTTVLEMLVVGKDAVWGVV